MSNYCTKTIPLSENVAKEKNKALREMLKTDRDYFFLVEENCKVLDESVYDKFIEVCKATGIETLMWPQPQNPRLPFELDKYISYYKDFDSEFAMYTRKVVETVGFLDEEMPPNTWQELEYAKRIGDMGLSSPFGIFAAPKDVDKYFEITKPNDGFKNLKALDEALTYWETKDPEDFPIDKRRQQTSQPIQMI